MSVFKNVFAWRQDCKLKSYAKPNSNEIIRRNISSKHQLPNLFMVANPHYQPLLIKPNYLVIFPPTQHRSFFKNLLPLTSLGTLA